MRQQAARVIVLILVAGLFTNTLTRSFTLCSNPKLVRCSGCNYAPKCSSEIESSTMILSSDISTADDVVIEKLEAPSFLEKIIPPSSFNPLNPCLFCDWNTYLWFL